ncbi:MAG TPA: hypothetical protein VMV94_09270 [Phycisphaerae bacterium]|nr:hypothetical protein [Phycisphaerae bacterium]
MKDKRLSCWLLGATALCCGLLFAPAGRAGPLAAPQPHAAFIPGHWPGDAGAFLLLQQPPTVERKDEPAEEEEADETAKQPPGLRKLTPQEINHLRFMELRGMRLTTEQPDKVTVKIPQQTVNDFLLEMQGERNFNKDMGLPEEAPSADGRAAFLRLTGPQKLHYMAFRDGAKYADRVEITSDPEVFLEFKKNVMPTVLRGCATTACHGSPDRGAGRFVLFNDPKRTTATTYGNFLMLNEIDYNGRRLIDRGQPENSLLLTYMLPPDAVKPELRHPGNVTYKPMFRSVAATKYRRIQAWIGSLKHPAEDYGIHFFPPPTSGPAEDLEKPAESRPSREPEKKPEAGPTKPEQRPPLPGRPDVER